MEHEGSQQAKRRFKDALDRAAAAGSWMAAVWCVKDGEIKLVQRTTSKFPTGDFLAAVGQLASNLFEETKGRAELPSSPLPQAFPDGRVRMDEIVCPLPDGRVRMDEIVGRVGPRVVEQDESVEAGGPVPAEGPPPQVDADEF